MAYAVMEKTDDAVVVPLSTDRSDIESWSHLWNVSKKYVNGSATCGDVMLHGSNCFYPRSDGKLVAANGLVFLVIVSTKVGLVVPPKDSVQDVKVVSQRLKDELRSEWEHHGEVYRPLGKNDSIDSGERYHVKPITL